MAITASFLTCTSTFAQQEIQKTDEMIILTAKRCYAAMLSSNEQKRQQFCDELKEYAKPLSTNKIAYLRSQIVLSISSSLTGKPEEASTNLSKAIKSFSLKSKEADMLRSEAYNVLGNIYMTRRQPKNAEDAIINSIKFADKTRNKGAVINAMSSLVGLYSSNGKQNKALEYAIKTVQAAEKAKKTDIDNYDQVMFGITRTLAMAYSLNRRIDKAIVTALKAEELAKSAFGENDTTNPSFGIKSDIASYYLSNNQYDKALPYAEAAIKTVDHWSGNLPSEFAFSFTNMLQIYILTDKISDAESLAIKFGDRIDNMPDSPQKVRALGSLGLFYKAHTTQSDIARKKLVEATLVAERLFGRDSTTTNELAELAGSITVKND